MERRIVAARRRCRGTGECSPRRSSARRGLPIALLAVASAVLAASADGFPLRAVGPSRSAAASATDERYEADLRFALDTLEEKCGHFFESKGIDWKAVRKELLAEVPAVKTDAEHFWLLQKLLGRLKDGHAEVRLREPTKGLDLGAPELTGAGLFLCRSGKKILVKSSWNDARAAGLVPGMEVLEVDGKPVQSWLQEQETYWRDRESFSTPQMAFAFVTQQGMVAPPGTRREFAVKDEKGKRKERTITYGRAKSGPWGPAFAPSLGGDSDLGYAVLSADFAGRKPAKGRKDAQYGYVHVRRCPSDLPDRMDKALAAIGPVDGLVLDWRGNSGGSFDHDALFGRFVPKGKTVAFAKSYASAGEQPYGGPLVAIVDGNVRSAGETGSGMFKEDGRGYLIGESATAGMSSSKEEVELPSGLFALYVSVASNKGRFNGGRGIEGLGVAPHEIVEYDALDLFAERDTLILRALELLEKSPWKEVPYDPARFGWGS